MWNTKEIIIGKVIIPTRIFSAPMAGISNMALRLVAREYGAGLVYTEMVSSEAIIRENPKTSKIMAIAPQEHPIAIQIFGNKPDSMAESAKIASEYADIVDINFGCPARTVTNGGSGSALMKNPKLIEEITSKVVKSATCPVTAKIRSGWDKNSINAVEIAKIIQDCGASAITVHPRTRSQGFSGLSDWNVIADVKENVSIPVIGNGDVNMPIDAKSMLEQTNCDAIMIGRGAIGNPWLFSSTIAYIHEGIMHPVPSDDEKLSQLMRFARLLFDIQGENIACLEIRKFVKWYTKGMQNISEMRNKAMQIRTLNELEELINPYMALTDHTMVI